MKLNWKVWTVVSIVLTYTLIIVAFSARATTEPRYDRFFSRRSGNVIFIPTRCWQEDSMAHLYEKRIVDHGATYVMGCHHRGY